MMALTRFIIFISTVCIVLIASLAAIVLLAPSLNAIAMLAIFGVIMITLLAISLGREIFICFNVDRRRGISAGLGSTNRTRNVGTEGGMSLPNRVVRCIRRRKE